MKDKPVVFISAVSSDIGIEMAKRYVNDGFIVVGTYRKTDLLSQLKKLKECHLFYCDLLDEDSIKRSCEDFKKLGLNWDMFISCAATPKPLTKFFECEFDDWKKAIDINVIQQIKVLHKLYSLRNKKRVCDVVFFAGPATNGPVSNFSALAVSKISLIKFCELINYEYEDIKAFIVGPGWTRTKTHDEIINDKNVCKEKYEQTVKFLESNQGTSMDDIYNCIQWISRQAKEISGGRNFSVVHDCWGKESLAKALREDYDMYKLRRFNNQWKERNGCND